MRRLNSNVRKVLFPSAEPSTPYDESGSKRESSDLAPGGRNAIPNRAFEVRAGGGHFLDACELGWLSGTGGSFRIQDCERSAGDRGAT